LQLFARLKANRLSRWDGYLRAGPGIATNPGLSRTHIEYSKASKLDSLAASQGSLHALENGFDGHLGLGLGDTRFIDDFVDYIEFDQIFLPVD
jgi:hypothetical protein